jgi:hypothetical protein
MKSPYRQLAPDEMVQVDHAVDDVMAIVKEARKRKDAVCASQNPSPPPERSAA